MRFSTFLFGDNMIDPDVRGSFSVRAKSENGRLTTSAWHLRASRPCAPLSVRHAGLLRQIHIIVKAFRIHDGSPVRARVWRNAGGSF
jgi:hypothetical protein